MCVREKQIHRQKQIQITKRQRETEIKRDRQDIERDRKTDIINKRMGIKVKTN